MKGLRTYRLFAGALALIKKIFLICQILDAFAFLNRWVVAASFGSFSFLFFSFFLRDFDIFMMYLWSERQNVGHLF